MNQNKTFFIIQSTFDASNKGEIHFGEVIQKLMSIQVESYIVDYRIGRSTYFLPHGETLDLFFDKPQNDIAEIFDAPSLRAAIVGAQ